MFKNYLPSAFGTGSSIVVDKCQVCGSDKLTDVLFLGFLPPVNTMQKIGTTPSEQPAYPALLRKCDKCQLFQLGLIVDPKILFPPEYPYTSGTTKILRDNFAELSQECQKFIKLNKEDLVIDIGSNDGTLLSNFVKLSRVYGIEPSDAGKLAQAKNIPTLISFFNLDTAKKVLKKHGKAKIITATNVFAHMENIHNVLEGILALLSDDGVFISESHYLFSIIRGLQYDTIYHEHLRYYSLTSLKNLLKMHGLNIFHAKLIPTHGGSIRVYASRNKKYSIQSGVDKILAREKQLSGKNSLEKFKERTMLSKLELMKLLLNIKKKGQHIYGIGAPSRASTLINYIGLDEGILDCVLEVTGSYKTGKFIPGKLIPVLDESKLFKDQPEYALLLSWHIARELIPKLKQKGFKGKFIVPLPKSKIIK
jgi:hypothetical protein